MSFARFDKIKIQGKTFQQKPFLKINAPASTPALSVKQYSNYKHEDEILLGRGCVLEVQASLAGNSTATTTKDNSKYYAGKLEVAEFPCKVVDVRPQELGFNEDDTHLEEDSEFKFLGVA